MNPSLRDNVWVWLEKMGVALVVLSSIILFLTFFPVIKEEARYQLSPKRGEVIVASSHDRTERELAGEEAGKQTIVVPVDENFGIIIPKLDANARVIPDVDWQDSRVYQEALTRGVAHARGTAKPGEDGNVFLFSHSGVDFFEANRYNALFYLIDKLVSGDEIVLMYQGQKFFYHVTDKKKVAPDTLQYLTGESTQKTLTLMTCWPAGTTLKRLLVIATQVTP